MIASLWVMIIGELREVILLEKAHTGYIFFALEKQPLAAAAASDISSRTFHLNRSKTLHQVL